jgi:hypothetical protein
MHFPEERAHSMSIPTVTRQTVFETGFSVSFMEGVLTAEDKHGSFCCTPDKGGAIVFRPYSTHFLGDGSLITGLAGQLVIRPVFELSGLRPTT